MTTSIVTANRQRVFGAIVTLVALFGAASGASAQQVHSWPGVECQSTGSAHDLSYSSTAGAGRFIDQLKFAETLR